MSIIKSVRSVLAGYVFDGIAFQRAAVNRHNEIVVKESGIPINLSPFLALWYTRREFQNAVAYLQARKQLPRDLDINTVFPTPELMARLKENGHLRTTEQHVLHLLTAGRERVLGVRFTDAEIKGYEAQAAAMVNDLDKVFSAKAQISA